VCFFLLHDFFKKSLSFVKSDNRSSTFVAAEKLKITSAIGEKKVSWEQNIGK